MKSGISLVDMAKEIQRQADLKADYMLDTRSLRRSIPLPTGRSAHT